MGCKIWLMHCICVALANLIHVNPLIADSNTLLLFFIIKFFGLVTSNALKSIQKSHTLFMDEFSNKEINGFLFCLIKIYDSV